MEITIRSAVPSDFGAIHQLILSFAHFIKTPEKVSVTPAQMLEAQNDFHCIVAEHDKTIIGFATYFPAYYSWTGKAIYLDDLYVLDAYRGKSVGSQLFGKILSIAKAAGCHKMRWQVSNWNTKAIAFYQKQGAFIDAVEINCDLLLG
jgi:GNAT superfamily N-acetyltransferase